MNSLAYATTTVSYLLASKDCRLVGCPMPYMAPCSNVATGPKTRHPRPWPSTRLCAVSVRHLTYDRYTPQLQGCQSLYTGHTSCSLPCPFEVSRRQSCLREGSHPGRDSPEALEAHFHLLFFRESIRLGEHRYVFSRLPTSSPLWCTTMVRA